MARERKVVKLYCSVTTKTAKTYEQLAISTGMNLSEVILAALEFAKNYVCIKRETVEITSLKDPIATFRPRKKKPTEAANVSMFARAPLSLAVFYEELAEQTNLDLTQVIKAALEFAETRIEIKKMQIEVVTSIFGT